VSADPGDPGDLGDLGDHGDHGDHRGDDDGCGGRVDGRRRR